MWIIDVFRQSDKDFLQYVDYKDFLQYVDYSRRKIIVVRNNFQLHKHEVTDENQLWHCIETINFLKMLGN